MPYFYGVRHGASLYPENVRIDQNVEHANEVVQNDCFDRYGHVRTSIDSMNGDVHRVLVKRVEERRCKRRRP